MHTTTWPKVIDDYRAWLRAAGRPDTTIYLRTYQLRRLAESFPAGPWTVSTDDLIRWLAGQEWSLETLRSWRSMIRTFYRWAVASGRIEESPAEALPPMPVPRRRARPAPDTAITEALIGAEPRERLMILLAAHAGLRRGEIARTHSDDLRHDLDGWWLTVHGKGARDRSVPLDSSTAAEIRRWLAGRQGWLFPGQIDGHLSPARVGELVTSRLPSAWTTHTLRHRFASTVYAGSQDLLATQTLLGHSKPETTQLYVQLGADSLRRAASFAA